ncbi:unnamed protein product [Cercopithifilaria johnstoni]|uniref:Uncharacterized protein n=1 Tax=Cercopithifilaria johnstoni TaxID=2874296 RepID=A0A8J2MGR4_9BILA|nr:unnamed protein product [Cercopithifilaria johnstoni]
MIRFASDRYSHHFRISIGNCFFSVALAVDQLRYGGLDNRMTSLTDYIPKCMLPIVGIPVFWYLLNCLQRNSIKIIAVVAERLLGEIKQLLSSSVLPSLNRFAD